MTQFKVFFAHHRLLTAYNQKNLSFKSISNFMSDYVNELLWLNVHVHG